MNVWIKGDLLHSDNRSATHIEGKFSFSPDVSDRPRWFSKFFVFVYIPSPASPYWYILRFATRAAAQKINTIDFKTSTVWEM